ncbi:hypothetical protein [Sphingomonas sp.]|uniref:hypothetical protein n=1 Tax=Sphingomonas sp. TaxID=28214 RepID=UPI002DD68EE8|nr:hypothetical protein [Sphingomonas sp.]
MILDFKAPFADALSAWRRDRALLLPLAGLTFLLPQLGVQLLLPGLPPLDPQAQGEAAMAAWRDAVVAWAGQHGGWFLLAPMIALFGALVVMALYLAPQRPTLGGALARAGALYLRFLLASILVSLPMGMLLAGAVSAPVLMLFAAAPIFYVYGRTMLMGPVIVAEAPVGAVEAVARSWRMTRGNGWIMASLYAAIYLIPALLGSLGLSIGALGASDAGPNPVLLAVGAVVAGIFSSIGALALALVAVAAYRRLASKGT